MLRYEINHAAGVPQSVVSGFAPRGEADHWTAGATGRAGALSAVQHFISTRTTVNASYHVLDWHDHAAEVTGAMEIVPLNRAAHSMNPAKAFVARDGSAREAARFAEVRRILARDSDPNADSIAVSFCGMPADLAAAVACPVYRADRRELSALLRRKVASLVDRPHFGHGWIQPTSRYETDSAHGGPDLLIAPVLYAVEEDDMYDWVAKMRPALIRATIMPGTPVRTAPLASADTFAFSMPSSGNTINFIGRVPDQGGGTIPYLVYVLGAGGVRVTREDNVVPGSLVELGVPTVTEVVKEVPTGITQDQLDAAHAAGAADEKARVRALLGL